MHKLNSGLNTHNFNLTLRVNYFFITANTHLIITHFTALFLEVGVIQALQKVIPLQDCVRGSKEAARILTQEVNCQQQFKKHHLH